MVKNTNRSEFAKSIIYYKSTYVKCIIDTPSILVYIVTIQIDFVVRFEMCSVFGRLEHVELVAKPGSWSGIFFFTRR